jgi:hypothetical protein
MEKIYYYRGETLISGCFFSITSRNKALSPRVHLEHIDNLTPLNLRLHADKPLSKI